MEIEIKPLNIDDYIDFVITSHYETFRITFGSEISHEFLEHELMRMRADSIADKDSVVGAFIDETIVGLTVHEKRVHKDNSEYGWIHFYYVSSNHRRFGVGTKLVDYSVEYFRKLNLKEFCLRTGEYNLGAQAFYHKTGFVHDQSEDRIGLNGVKELMMKYTIAEESV